LIGHCLLLVKVAATRVELVGADQFPYAEAAVYQKSSFYHQVMVIAHRAILQSV
jgi:hypothetical protein